MTTMLNLFCKEKSPWVHQEEHAAENFKAHGVYFLIIFQFFSLMHNFLALLAKNKNKNKSWKEIESGHPNWLETLKGETSFGTAGKYNGTTVTETHPCEDFP